ncbi:MAG TPA: trigger factor [Firmicutes bacterium]|nr:trigger factor [Bacillota bacterium]
MQSQLEKLSECRVVLEVEVSSPEVDKALDAAYKKVAQQVTVPGFRKGKTPRAVIESRFGKEVLVEEALEIIVSETYQNALEQHKLEPIDHPEDFELIEPLQEGSGMKYKVAVDILPEVKLGDYSTIRVAVEPEQITEERLNQEIERLRENYSSLENTDRTTVQTGDFAVIDFEGYVDGEAFQGGAGEGYTLEIGSGTFIPGFEEGLIGANLNETIDVKTTFPEDYRAEFLAGKEAIFKVTVKEIKAKKLPDFNDELAKEAGYESLEELKQTLEERLQEEAKRKAEADQREQIVKQAVEGSELIVPEKLIERELDRSVANIKGRLEASGMSFEQYLEASQTTEESYREDLKPTAANNVKTELVLNAISEKEGITVEIDELRSEVGRLAVAVRQDASKLFKRLEKEGRLAGLADSMVREKTVDFLAKLATATNSEKEG